MTLPYQTSCPPNAAYQDLVFSLTSEALNHQNTHFPNSVNPPQHWTSAALGPHPPQPVLSRASGPVLLDISSLILKHGDEWSYQPVARPLPLDNPGAIWVTLKENSYQ